MNRVLPSWLLCGEAVVYQPNKLYTSCAKVILNNNLDRSELFNLNLPQEKILIKSNTCSMWQSERNVSYFLLWSKESLSSFLEDFHFEYIYNTDIVLLHKVNHIIKKEDRYIRRLKCKRKLSF